MNQRDNNLKFKKVTNDSRNLSKLPNRKDRIISMIMDKFNVTPAEAEKILFEIEKREKISNAKNENSNKNAVKEFKINQSFENSNSRKNKIIKNSLNKNNEHKFISQHNYEKNIRDVPKVKDNSKSGVNIEIFEGDNNQHTNQNVRGNKINVVDFDNNQSSKDNQNKQNNVKRGNENQIEISKPNINKKLSQKNQHLEKNVDSLLEGIIPDYNKQISIKVNHVDLTFEVQNEKVETLKESFIRILKRNKSEKVKIHALRDISFQIYKGEKVGIIGYNGAGKSTLLNVIVGIYPPDKGEVLTYGSISPLLSLGAGFDYNFSGRRNIVLSGAVLGYSKEFLESKIDEIIEFSELGELIDIPIKNYSSGMLAKLGFSIATIVEPDILIIDEVLGVGDVNFQKKSRDKIKSLMDGGTTVLLVSHSVPQVRELCDKAIWIDDGKLKEIGEVNKVCDHYLKDAEKASNEQLANIKLVN